MSEDNTAAQAFSKLLEVITELRARDPWDRAQKLADTPHRLIEEAYEVAEAIARGNLSEAAEELGDVMIQCLFTSLILGEHSKSNIATIMRNSRRKTHPAQSACLRTTNAPSRSSKFRKSGSG